MPVWKYRSIEEMNEGDRKRWLPSFDPRLAARMKELWATAFRLSGSYVPPRGVFKFRSIEEANAHREAWERERIALLEARRKKKAAEEAKP